MSTHQGNTLEQTQSLADPSFLPLSANPSNGNRDLSIRHVPFRKKKKNLISVPRIGVAMPYE